MSAPNAMTNPFASKRNTAEGDQDGDNGINVQAGGANQVHEELPPVQSDTSGSPPLKLWPRPKKAATFKELGIELHSPFRSIDYKKSHMELGIHLKRQDSYEPQLAQVDWQQIQYAKVKGKGKAQEVGYAPPSAKQRTDFPFSKAGVQHADTRRSFAHRSPLKMGWSAAILDDDPYLAVPDHERRSRRSKKAALKRARDLTGKKWWRWTPGEGYVYRRSKDLRALTQAGGPGIALAQLLPPREAPPLAIPPYMPGQEALSRVKVFLITFLVLGIAIYIVQEWLGFFRETPTHIQWDDWSFAGSPRKRRRSSDTPDPGSHMHLHSSSSSQQRQATSSGVLASIQSYVQSFVVSSSRRSEKDRRRDSDATDASSHRADDGWHSAVEEYETIAMNRHSHSHAHSRVQSSSSMVGDWRAQTSSSSSSSAFSPLSSPMLHHTRYDASASRYSEVPPALPVSPNWSPTLMPHRVTGLQHHQPGLSTASSSMQTHAHAPSLSYSVSSVGSASVPSTAPTSPSPRSTSPVTATSAALQNGCPPVLDQPPDTEPEWLVQARLMARTPPVRSPLGKRPS